MIKRHPSRDTALHNRRLSESRAAEVVTVAWMLCTLTTLIAEGGVVLVRLLLSLTDPIVREDNVVNGWMQLFVALALIAVTSGVCSLLLLPVVYWLRQAPPLGPSRSGPVSLQFYRLWQFYGW